MYITTILWGKRKKKIERHQGRCPEATGTAAGPSSATRTDARGQRFLQALQNETIHRQDFPSYLWKLGESWTGSMPRSTRALEIPMTSYASRPASAVCSPLILSTCMRVFSSSAERSCPSRGCRPRSCNSTSITSHTSRSVS
jgi:hypothetical protein